jgi:hypothetical protein
VPKRFVAMVRPSSVIKWCHSRAVPTRKIAPRVIVRLHHSTKAVVRSPRSAVPATWTLMLLESRQIVKKIGTRRTSCGIGPVVLLPT